ncbi:MAG: zinc ABC transporter substrate-binding protein [Planctomycetes bacterium]|nr:zinc ABC transporter substrate-binding protein [Planctomycetota bacterium]
MRYSWLVVAVAVIAVLVSHARAQTMKVVVTVPPLAGIVKPLLPPDASVEVLIPAGVSEHGYDIAPSKLSSIANADMLVYVGMGLEPQVEKLVKGHPKAGRADIRFSAVVGIAEERDAVAEHHDHEAADHDHDHDHGHGDPHLWLDAQMVKTLARACAGVIKQAAKTPEAQRAGDERLAAFLAKVDGVDARYRDTVDAAPRKTIIVGHDAYQHLAKRYGLKTVAVAGLNANEPTPSALAAVSEAAKEHGATVVFSEPQISPKVVSRVAAACKLKVRTLDPLGDGDWFAMMDKNLAEIAGALGAKAPELQSK